MRPPPAAGVAVARLPLDDVEGAVYDRLTGRSVFAARDFIGLWRVLGGRPVAWVARVDGAVAAVLPGVEFGRRPLTRFMSLPDGCYGGVFADPEAPVSRAAVTAPLLAAVQGAGYLRTLLFDYDGHLGRADGFRELPLRTALVDISARDWEPPDPKLMSQIRKAEREGIVVTPFHWDRHGGAFLALVAETAARQGRPVHYPEAFFRELAALAEREPRIHWVWCERGGRGACSHIYLLERGDLQGWQIHFSKDFSYLKPNQYIRFMTCREMARRGIRRLNLGGTPENAPGVVYYKRRWGGRPVHYRALEHRSGLGRLAAALHKPHFGA